MQVEFNKKEVEFEPITFTVTLEDINELKSWWARMNKHSTWTDDQPEARGADCSTTSLWRHLNEELNKYPKMRIGYET